MQKILSSLVILSALLLCLWSLSAWYLGQENRDALYSFLDKNKQNPNAIFSLSIKNFSSSIKDSKGSLILDLNNSYRDYSILNKIPEQILVYFTIKNGPILINKKGLSLGKARITLSLGESSDIQSILIGYNNNNISLDQLFHVDLKRSFDELIEYSFSVKQRDLDMLIYGEYNSDTNNHNGSISTKEIQINENDLIAKLNQVKIKYKSLSKIQNGINVPDKFYIRTIIPELKIKHKNMQDFLTLNTIHNGNITFKDNSIDSFSTVEVSKLVQTQYPIEKGVFDFKVSNLNLNDFSTLLQQFSHIQNLQEQSQWVLDEQGEIPEGQDKIWQLQDQVKRSSITLPTLAEKAFKSNDSKKPVFTFKLLNHYKSKQSTLSGFIDAINSEEHDYEMVNSSLSNLAQVNANVSIDKLLYDFISKVMPINKDQFKLTYKHKQLLMQ